MPQGTYPVVTRTARFDILGSLIGGFSVIEAQTSLFVQAPAANSWELADLVDMNALLIQWWDDEMQPLMSNQATLVGVRGKDLGEENGFAFVTEASVTGSVASELAAAVSAPVVQLYGAGGGTPLRSEMRPWGTPETGSHGNVLESTFRTNLNAAMLDLYVLVEAFNGSTWGVATAQWVLVSVANPGWKAGEDPPSERYRDLGVTNHVVSITTRSLLGRSVSRQT